MTRPAPVVVWLNGSLVDPDSASIRFDDHGITVGDGVFETIKTVGARPFALGAHLERLERSARGLMMEPPGRATVERAVGETAAAWEAATDGSTVGRVRVTLTTGPGPAGSGRGGGPPTVLVTASELTLSREPTDVVTVEWTRNERGALAGLKTTSYAENVLALARAEELGATEALFANSRGELCEGTGTNVFVESGGRLATPPLDSGCLDGITRRLLLDALADRGVDVSEEPLPHTVISQTSEAFLVSTGREVQPIAAVDGHDLEHAPGPLTRAAMEAWDHHHG